MRRFKFFTIILITSSLLFVIGSAQTSTIDSLENLLEKHSGNDTLQIELLKQLAFAYWFRADSHQALTYYEKALKCADEAGLQEDKSDILCLTGEFYKQKGSFPEAIEYFRKALKIARLNNY
ncbi:MAG: tetratricopeptide repeat protein, partial [Bacteroidota bacterium]